MLCEALQREDECFDFACRSTSRCFDGRFVLEEEFSWIGVSIILWENGRVEACRPLDLFEFHREGGAEASSVLPMLLLHHSVFAFFFARVHFFLDDDESWAKPDGLRGVRCDGRWFVAKGPALVVASPCAIEFGVARLCSKALPP